MFFTSSKNQKVFQAFKEHKHDVVKCFEKFEEFFITLTSEEKVSREVLQSLKITIDNYEESADRELRHVVDLLSESFLPSTRSELISLVQITDKIANNCQGVARHLYLERTIIPDSLINDIRDIIAITKSQLEIIYNAIDMLFNDYKTLFKDRKILDDVRGKESKVDNIEQMLYERIFELDIDLCEKVYYRDILCNICQISDIIEDISDNIHIMLIEREM